MLKHWKCCKLASLSVVWYEIQSEKKLPFDEFFCKTKEHIHKIVKKYLLCLYIYYIVKCERILQQERSLCFSCLHMFTDLLTTFLQICLWTQGSYTLQTVLLSSAQFGQKYRELCKL